MLYLFNQGRTIFFPDSTQKASQALVLLQAISTKASECGKTAATWQALTLQPFPNVQFWNNSVIVEQRTRDTCLSRQGFPALALNPPARRIGCAARLNVQSLRKAAWPTALAGKQPGQGPGEKRARLMPFHAPANPA